MIEETNSYAFKGVWIPREIWEATDITWMEKCLLAEINALEEPKKGCFASNEYLAKKFDSSPASIANQISKLRKLCYVETIGFDGRQRRLRVRPELIRRLKRGSLEGLLRFHQQVEALIQEKRGELPAEEKPLGPHGGQMELKAPTSIESKRSYLEGFDEFWEAYPKKVKKDKARAIWIRKRCNFIREEIMLALSIHKASPAWLKGKPPGQFIPHPTSWLNGGEWQNEGAESAPKKILKGWV